MTIIDGVRGGPSRVAAVRRPQRRDGDLAYAATEPEAIDVASVAPTANPAALGGLLALQEREAGDIADRKGRRRGTALLDGLAGLQLALLRPDGPAESELTDLSHLCEDVPEAADPTLQALLRSIALRARIELMRRGTTV